MKAITLNETKTKNYIISTQNKKERIINGYGIASEHLDRITERFYRVDKARLRTTGGSGLGLSIVKHVLSHHNSLLNIQSRIGKGSIFSCRFSPEQTYIVEKPVGS